MGKSMTGSFYLTESVNLTAASADGTRVQDTISLAPYISVPEGIAIAIESVDFITQLGSTHAANVDAMLAANGSIGFQLSDQNPGTEFLAATDTSLVASGALNIDAANNIATHSQDFYPDNFGPSSADSAFLVVNPLLYITAGNDGAAVGADRVEVCVRVRARIIRLSKRDWVAIAIQSTAE